MHLLGNIPFSKGSNTGGGGAKQVVWDFWTISSGGAVPRPQEIPNQFSALCHNPELQAISVTGPVEF